MDSLTDYRDHTIKDFLERPVILFNKEWDTTMPQGKMIASLDMENVFKNPMYASKLSNFTGIRCDFDIRVQVNAMPFQAGRLLLQYIPFYLNLGDRKEFYTDESRASTLTAITGCPHIDLDIASETEMTFKIPFVSNQSHWCPAFSNSNTLGRFRVVVYSPLKSASTTKVDLTIWVSLSNITLSYPTGVVTQSTEGEITKGGDGDILDLKVGADAIAAKVSLDVVRDTFPWSFAGLEGLKKMFGFSKPINSQVSTLVRPKFTRFMANYDGIDDSHNFGLASTNELEKASHNDLTDNDELAISSITQVKNFYRSFDWSTSSKYQDVLYKTTVHPMLMSPVSVNGSSDYWQPTLVSYVSSNFMAWRGGMSFTFKVIKTKFHSGRLRVIYQPYSSDLTNSDACYSKILDLRSASDFTFECPFVSPTPFKRVCPLDKITAPTYVDACGTLFIQVLNELVAPETVANTVQVLVEVAAAPDFELAGPTFPNLCPATLPAPAPGVFGKAAVHLGLSSTDASTSAKPEATTQPNWMAYQINGKDTDCVMRGKEVLFYNTKTANWEKADPNKCVPVTQSGRDITNAPEQSEQKELVAVQNSIDNTSPMITTIHIPGRAFGEKITSMRQLLKRFMVMDYHAEKITQKTSIIIAPWKIYKPYNKVKSQTGDDTLFYDYYDIVAHIFAFLRGGMRVKIVPTNQDTSLQVATMLCRYTDAKYPELNDQKIFISEEPDPGFAQQTLMAPTFVIPQAEQIGEYSFPYYSTVNFLPATDENHTKDNIAKNLIPAPALRTFINVSGADVSGVITYRSCADDFSFFGLLGAPIIKIRSK